MNPVLLALVTYMLGYQCLLSIGFGAWIKGRISRSASGSGSLASPLGRFSHWATLKIVTLSIKLVGTMTICSRFQPKLRNHLGEGSRCSGQRLGRLAALRCLDIDFEGQAS